MTHLGVRVDPPEPYHPAGFAQINVDGFPLAWAYVNRDGALIVHVADQRRPFDMTYLPALRAAEGSPISIDDDSPIEIE